MTTMTNWAPTASSRTVKCSRREQTGEIVPVENVIFLRLPHTLVENGEHWAMRVSEKDENGLLIPAEGWFMNSGTMYPIQYTRRNPRRSRPAADTRG